MDPTTLGTFMAVARHGSVTAAARELHTVQSNVTTRLKQLEAELAVPLFERHSRGMSLTAAGTRLLSYAQKLDSLRVEALEAVRDTGAVRGSLRIGSMETTAALRLAEVLGRFHRLRPAVQIEVKTGPTAELLELVLARRLDGAFVAGPVEHPSIDSVVAFHEELVLIAAAGSPAMRERLRAQALTAIVFREGCSYRQLLETEFSRRGWLPYQRIEFGTVEGILGCVAADVGVTVLPRAVVERIGAKRALRIEAFKPRSLRVETLFVRRVDAPQTAALREFAAMLDVKTGRARGGRRSAKA